MSVLVSLPLHVHVKEGEVVALRNLKLLSCGVTFLLASLGTKKDRWHGQHGHDGL